MQRFGRVHAESGLSHGQIQIWAGQTRFPDSPLYNMAFTFFFKGEVDAEVFAASWQRVVDESDALRTSLEVCDGVPRRRVRDAGACALKFMDLTEEADPEHAFSKWARERCAQALPLEGELIDSILVKFGEERWGWYLNQHHLITDAFSTVLLYQRVAAEYARLLGGGESPAPLASYYETIAVVQEGAGGPAGSEAADEDAGRRSGVTVPFYGEPGVPASTPSRRNTLTIGRSQSQQLRELAGESGFVSFTPEISLFSLFSTLLSASLHRVSGSGEVGFDAPAQSRSTPAARESLGLFIEMFPFAVAVEEGMTFRDLGERCLAAAMEFLARARPGTSAPSGAEASNVVLNFFMGSFGDFAGIPVSSEWVHSGHGDSPHALRLQVHDYDGTGQFSLHFDFNEEIFPEKQQRRAMEHFQILLAAVLENPDRVLGEIDLLTGEERKAVMDDFNAETPHPLPRRSVVEMFDAQVAVHPEGVAVKEGKRTLTFEELKGRVDTLAGVLRAGGVQAGMPVAICMGRSIEVVVAILAVLKVRAFYVPLDPGNPAQRIKHILEDSGAGMVLVREGEEAGVEEFGIPHLVVESGPAETTRWEDDPHQLSETAYMIYTSGSTGVPKGVPITHGGLADYLEWAVRQYVRGDQLTFPLFTSLSFDLTVTSVFLPLITGGTMMIYGECEGPVDFAVMDVVRDNQADFIKLTPSHLSLLRQMDLSSSRLQRMVVGGEDFKTHLAVAIAAQFGDRIEIYNEYGPTEAVVGCMIHRFDPATDQSGSVPIGRPADHVQLYVLNDSLQPVPEGVPGELCISRHGLARGYHDRDELTARQFIDHPFREGERLYRTGDLVRFARPGCLEYLGRMDRQMKVSGVRVEAGEIESAVLSHPAVKDCVIALVGGSGRDDGDPADLQYCERCGLASDYPDATFDGEGVCSVCRSYEEVKGRTADYFGTLDDLRAIVARSAERGKGDYDCMMLLSGGKDSTYALCQLVEMGYKVYTFSLDNGYISEGAKDNIRRVVETLGVAHEFATTPAMNAIFRDSLTRFSNVCNGCFKTIYTLSVNRARELGIPVIVTGLSRGQFFETRLTEQMFRDGRCDPAEIDRAVLAARKAYHRVEDEVNRSLDVSCFRDDAVFEEIEFVDFYRYTEASLGEMLAYLSEKVPWVRPADTGRSTNCLVNDVGIYIHKKERHFHNYALPYSWDVRMGHKTRQEAMEELDDELDLGKVRKMLAEIGYDENRLAGSEGPTGVAAYYVAEEVVPDEELRTHLAGHLPPQLVPQFFHRVETVPLTASGKIDYAALPAVSREGGLGALVVPEGPVQERVAEIWSEILHLEEIDAVKSFFEHGGTSLAAMEVMLRLCQEFELDLPLQTAFQFPTVAGLAKVVEDQIVAELAELSEEEAERLVEEQQSES